VALKYKQLWMVEDVFRSMKSLLDTRPDLSQVRRNHSRARVLLVPGVLVAQALQDRLARKAWEARMGRRSIRDLDNLIEMEVPISGKSYVFRGQTPGVAGKVFQACGVALPPALRSC